jgi:succinate-acetate transporter protein
MSGLPPPPAGAANGDGLRATRVFLRPIASPFGLGFAGLAVATLLAAGGELGWIPLAGRAQAGLLILAFAFPIQLVACTFGFLARDAVAATALGVQSATWLCVGLTLVTSVPGTTSRALALLLFVSGTLMLFSAGTAARAKLLPAAVLGLTGLRYILTGVFEMGAGTGWGHVAGWTGVVLCALALYAATSLELEEMAHRSVLPTLRRGKGRQALHPRLEEQVEEVAAEAGVRSQL